MTMQTLTSPYLLTPTGQKIVMTQEPSGWWKATAVEQRLDQPDGDKTWITGIGATRVDAIYSFMNSYDRAAKNLRRTP